jgi:hypothetical protein
MALATVTPSFVILGLKVRKRLHFMGGINLPKLCSMRTFRPFGPRVTATALASISTPFNRDARPSTPNFNSLCPAYPRRATIDLTDCGVERATARLARVRYISSFQQYERAERQDEADGRQEVMEFSRRSSPEKRRRKKKKFCGDDLDEVSMHIGIAGKLHCQKRTRVI